MQYCGFVSPHSRISFEELENVRTNDIRRQSVKQLDEPNASETNYAMIYLFSCDELDAGSETKETVQPHNIHFQNATTFLRFIFIRIKTDCEKAKAKAIISLLVARMRAGVRTTIK